MMLEKDDLCLRLGLNFPKEQMNLKSNPSVSATPSSSSFGVLRRSSLNESFNSSGMETKRSKNNKRTKMKRNRALLCLVTMLLLIAAADSTGETVVRLEMAHRDTLWPTQFHLIEDIIGEDQKRHSHISQKRKVKRGAKLALGLSMHIVGLAISVSFSRFSSIYTFV